MSLIAVVDYGMGNLRSVSKAIEHVAKNSDQVIVTSNPEDINNADHVVFPGQGAARDCMQELKARHLADVVLKAAAEKPFLGICMGMQVLLAHSEENQGVDCLNLFQGDVHRFSNEMLDDEGLKLKVPHMGWNQVHWAIEHPLLQNIEQDSRFYFVHSYYADPSDAGIIAARTQYGIDFVCALAKNNVMAVQFHPEKSAADGLQLLKNFCHWNGQP
ncbi:MAG: imidazole glycerol phosphate synthase subunit HisH [Gammaproteobacteria bacterium]|nr:imidazole glycerol phosphate synthase subunit HisH [Gammaproteobacteria bacterium]